MNIKKLNFALILLLFSLAIHSQELKVSSFEQDASDLTAVKDSVHDANNDVCALVIVDVVGHNPQFDGDVVKVVNKGNNRYWVYMPTGSNFLEIKVDDSLPLAVEFGKFAVQQVCGKSTYLLQVDKTIQTESRYEEAMLEAMQKSPLGYYKLGECYYQGDGVNRDYNKAMEYFQKAVDNGFHKGLVRLGDLYLSGFGVNKDVQKAKSYYDEAIRKNIALGYRGLGEYYYVTDSSKTISVPNNGELKNIALIADNHSKNITIPLYLYYFVKGASLQEARSYAYLALFLTQGQGVKKNERLGLAYYQSAVNKGDVVAMGFMADCYSKGIYVTKDDKKYFELVNLAAQCGGADEQCRLGQAYLMGTGTSVDIAKGIETLKKGALGGSKDCSLILGYIYRDGKYTTKNIEEAEHYFRLAARTGSGEAQYSLGKLYYFEKDDYHTAMNWFKKAYEIGKSTKESYFAKVCLYIAYVYRTQQFNNDWDNAITFLKEAYDSGQDDVRASACYYIAESYLGKDDNQNFLLWLNKGADSNYPDCAYLLAVVYKLGLGVTPNEEISKKFYNKAIKCGFNNNELKNKYGQYLQ